MKNFEKKETNLNQLIAKLANLNTSYSQHNFDNKSIEKERDSIKNEKEELREFKGPEHLFFFEAELSSQTILKEKQQVPYPGMTWEDTLGNLKVLDLWRQKINYQIKEDNL